tara:strand:+ start:4777 stop:4995 length:219 start_codon:yes stop_codon:yes gene_type:complete
MRILITGVARFIGFNFSEFLLKKNYKIVGVDNINNYYSQKLKKEKYKLIKNFTLFEAGIKNTLDWYKKYNNI